ncbi:MAG: cobalamin B12-binding domain-containing protein [Paracraurococcus sp.]|jgi:methanogenic corrinoid protein MtbC1
MVALGQSVASRHRADSPTFPARRALAGAASPWPQVDDPQDDRAARRQALADAIEGSVLPRLLLTHGPAPQTEPAAPPGIMPSAADVETLCTMLLVDDRDAAVAHVDALRDRGVTLQHVCLDLLAPAARWLGEAWNDDRCDFSTVTLGLMRLQHIFRDLQPEFTRDTRPQSRSRRILLVIAPGEQHGFGRDMLAGFFRHAGWDVVAPPPGSVADFAAVIRQESFEVVGFSAATDTRLDAVATCIRAVRKSARNHACGIMVGGPIFIARPENVALVGADATAADGQQATLQAERMMTLMTHRD